MYAVSFFLPSFALSGGISPRPDADLTTYGYELFPEAIGVIQQTPDLVRVLGHSLVLPNLIFLMTLLAFWRPRPSWKSWTAWLVGATGAFPLGQGLLRLGDLGPGMHAGVGFWVWSTSFLVVAVALWLRSREWASVQPKKSIA